MGLVTMVTSPNYSQGSQHSKAIIILKLTIQKSLGAGMQGIQICTISHVYL